MADKTRCMRCMKEYDGQYDVCPHCGYKRNAAPKNPMHLPEGTMLNDKYILGEVIGQGGFGITYVAFDISLERKVAIKEYFPYGLSTRTTASPTVMPVTAQQTENNYEYGKQKFIEEARTLARFSHMESIVSVSSYFEQNNTVYIVMEYLDGEDLLKHVKDRGGKIGLDETLTLIAPVFDALEAIHAAGMIHRDISPDNIFITRDGKTKLVDFGTARFAMGERSKSLSVILTPGYAPPEQYFSKGKQGPWTDVFSLAATIYRCVTGQRPAEAVERQAGAELTPPNQLGANIPQEFETKLMGALALKPEYRPQTISEFREELFRANEKTLDSQKRNKEKSANKYLSEDGVAAAENVYGYDNNMDSVSQKKPVKGLVEENRKKLRRRWILITAAIVAIVVAVIIMATTGVFDERTTIGGRTFYTKSYGVTLSRLNISDISALSRSTNLEVLKLDNNNIRDISALSGLTDLEFLLLHNNNIRDISALSGLTDLEILSLDNNSISDISALSSLTNLEKLYLDGNNISDISALEGLEELKYLHIDSTVYNNNPETINMLEEAGCTVEID